MFKWTFYKEIFLKIHSKTHNMHALIMKFKSTSGKKNYDQTKQAINSLRHIFLHRPNAGLSFWLSMLVLFKRFINQNFHKILDEAITWRDSLWRFEWTGLTARFY